MNQFEKLFNRMKGLTEAITRFPLTAVFLLVATVINAVDINTDGSQYSKYLLTFVVGGFLGAAVQVFYERFFHKISTRFLLMVVTALLTVAYYLIIKSVPSLSMEIGIRTSVALFTLLIVFIWVPVIKSKISFNESFMVSFKAFFISIFFAGIIFGGTSIIISAVNQLLFAVDHNSYSHTANIVFVLYAPMFFLSLIPVYLGDNKNKDQESINQQEEVLEKASNCPKYLEILFSFIIIPLIAIFTIILLLYIIINIGDNFWTNNLLEPMIISYSIIVILVYILTSRIDNKFAELFRRIFPKVLVPIVLFQTIASIVKIGEMGITHTRYYAILFGVFATIAGILFSIIPVRKNGIVAAMLIGFSIISIVPPVDAFSISRTSQIDLLESVLLENEMLDNNLLKPNTSISEKDKQKIIKVVNYLDRMEYTDKIPWIPENFNYYEDFYETFGFYQYEQIDESKQYINLYLPQNTPINIDGYDYLVFTNILISLSRQNEEVNSVIGEIQKVDKLYTLTKNIVQDQGYIKIVDNSNQEIISLSINMISDKFEAFDTNEGLLSVEEATFSKENQLAKITCVVQNFYMDKSIEHSNYGADIYVFVTIK